MEANAPAPGSGTELTSRRHRGLRGQRDSAQQQTTRVAAPVLRRAGVALVALCFASLAWAEGAPFEIAHVGRAALADQLEHLSRFADGGSRSSLDVALLGPDHAAVLARSLRAGDREARAAEVLVERDRWLVGALNPDHDDDYAYRLPYAADESYLVLQGYGSQLSHKGSEYFTVDFKMREGTPVHAAREGIVVLVEASHDHGCWAADCAGLANYVVVLHPDGTTGEYFHILKDGVLVEPGQHVVRGQLIALSGNTGYSTTPHLHFGVYERGPSGVTHSIGIRFATRNGIVDAPRPGARYLNASR